MRYFSLKFLAAALASLAAVTTSFAKDKVDVDMFQPPIVLDQVPEVLYGWKISVPLKRVDLPMLQSLVPAYNGKGKLFAVWKPQPDGVVGHPTVIVMHGGHGLGPGELETGRWAFVTMKANILVLDSYWSRGIHENWKTTTKYGANMRMLDAIAAARFTRDQGADPKSTFLTGDSQGGWTVLRTFTASNPMIDEVKSLFAGGFAMYPNCDQAEPLFGITNQFMPFLGGEYALPVEVLTGSADQATSIGSCDQKKVFKTAYKWINFEGATHAWDAPTEGLGRESVEGKCNDAKNVYNHFPMCYNGYYTKVTHDEFLKFVAKFQDRPDATFAPEPSQVIADPRTEEEKHVVVP